MAHVPNDIRFRAEILLRDMARLQPDFHSRSDQWEALEQESWIVKQALAAIHEVTPSKRHPSVLIATSLEPQFPELCGRLSQLYFDIDTLLDRPS